METKTTNSLDEETITKETTTSLSKEGIKKIILLIINTIWLNQRFWKLYNWKMIVNIPGLRMKNYRIISLK